MSKTEIVRTIQYEDKTIHVHIHLSQSEVNRLLLPLITSAFASELQRYAWRPEIANGTSSQRGDH